MLLGDDMFLRDGAIRCTPGGGDSIRNDPQRVLGRTVVFRRPLLLRGLVQNTLGLELEYRNEVRRIDQCFVFDTFI
jgi:hypothetical protein